MSEKPILFSGEMVRAILDGRKTQTRRIGRCQMNDATELGVEYIGHATKGKVAQATYRAFPNGGSARWALCECPYGIPGDRLWVKETFGIITAKHSQRWPKGAIAYRADHGETHGGIEYDLMLWKPSIFMPRKASRITLEIASLRVERLQSITHYDCEKEGLNHYGRAHWSCPGSEEIFREGSDGYRWLWESINGKGSWKANPWVWVVTFKQVFND